MRTRKSLRAADSDDEGEELELPEKAKKELQIDGKDTLKGEKRKESTSRTYKWGGRYYEVTPDTPAEWLKGKPVKDNGKRWSLPAATSFASSSTTVVPSSSSTTVLPSSSSTTIVPSSSSTTAPRPSSTFQKTSLKDDNHIDTHASTSTKKARTGARGAHIENPHMQQPVPTKNPAPARTTDRLQRLMAGIFSNLPTPRVAREDNSIAVASAPGSRNRSAAPATSIDGSKHVSSPLFAKGTQRLGATSLKAVGDRPFLGSGACKQSSPKQMKDSAPTDEARIGSKRVREGEAGGEGGSPAKKHASESTTTARPQPVQTELNPWSELAPKSAKLGLVPWPHAKPAWTPMKADSAPSSQANSKTKPSQRVLPWAESAAKLPPPDPQRLTQLKPKDSTTQHKFTSSRPNQRALPWANSPAKLPPPDPQRLTQLKPKDSTTQHKFTSSRPNTDLPRERAIPEAEAQPTSRVKSTATPQMPSAPERQHLITQQEDSASLNAPLTANQSDAIPAAAATPRVDAETRPHPIEAQAGCTSHAKSGQRPAASDVAPIAHPHSAAKLPTPPASNTQPGQAFQKQSSSRSAPSKVFPGMFEPDEVRNFSITLVKMARLNSTIDRRQQEADKIFADIQKLKDKLKEKREAPHRLREQLREARAEEEEMNTDSEDEKDRAQDDVSSHASQGVCGSEREREQRQGQLPGSVDPTRTSSSSDQNPVIAENTPPDTSKETTPDTHPASPESSRSEVLFPATNRGGQVLRWSPQDVQKNAANTDRAEYAIHQGRLDGESKSARRRRIRREMKRLQTLPDQIRGGSGKEA